MTNSSDLNRRSLLRGGLAVGGALIGGALVPGTAHAATMAANPLIRQRADPFIVRHNGMYYFTASVPEYDRVVLRASSTIAGLSTAREVTIWRRPASGAMGGHIWAPELHFVDGRWHIYFAAGDSGDVFHIRMYVLVTSSADPLQGTWSVLGRITTPLDTFALDATTFVHSGQRYLCWAQHDPAVGSGTNLYLARMSGPAAITGTPVRIATPTYAWETVGHRVNEGPAVLIRNGRVFIAYSASATDANYCMGLLNADVTANLLNPASWSKHPSPVFRSWPDNGQWGPGHNCFTVAENGVNDLFVYHARQYEQINGDPLYDPNRHTRVQRLHYHADGTPKFGRPLPDGPVRLS